MQVMASGEPLAATSLAQPVPETDGVVVRVRHCGICHTDLHLHDGYFGLGGERRLALKQTLPLTLGHEIQGDVHAIGSGVSGVRVGDIVAVYPWIGCDHCALCASGREHLCGQGRALGVQQPGGYAEFVAVPHARYLLPAADLDPRQAALLMCSGLSAYSAIAKVASAFESGSPVAIIGFGGLGQMALEIARARFAALPLVIDVAADKLALARSLGAEAFDLNDPDLVRTLRGAYGEISAVIDFVGAESTSGIAGRLCGQAGHIVIVGLFGGSLQTPLPLLALRGTTIQGSYVGTLDEARAVLALARDGKLAPIPVADCTLDAVNDGFSRLRSGDVKGRLAINFN